LTRVAVTIACGVSAATIAACGGEKGADTGAAPTGGSPTTVVSCWREVAEAYAGVNSAGLDVLGDYVFDMLELYQAMVAADAGPIEEFKVAYRRFGKALESTARRAEEFLQANDDTAARLAECSDEAAASETVPSCWERVAEAYEAAGSQAEATLLEHLQPIFDEFRTILDAAEVKDRAAVRAGEDRLDAKYQRMADDGGRFARLAGMAEREQELCSSSSG
jgi:hypothetical protein